MSSATQLRSRGRSAVRSAGHLMARLVTSIPGHPPAVTEELWAEDQLTPAEQVLWRAMSNQDRRHSIVVARRFAAPGRTRAQIAGALLHDVGKVECGLGTFGRVAATLMGPRGQRFRAYHDHEEIGAVLVAQCGSAPETIDLVAGTGPLADALRACDHA